MSATWSRLRKWFWGAIIAVGIFFIYFTFVPNHRIVIHRCLHCLAEKRKDEWYGFSFYSETPSEFSAWYESHNPSHTHDWRAMTCNFESFATKGCAYCRYGWLSVIRAKDVLFLAENSPADYEKYRAILLTDESQWKTSPDDFLVERVIELNEY